MSQNIYRFGFWRVINISILPFFGLLFTILLIESKYNGLKDIKTIDIFAWLFFFIFFVGVFFLLFINHLPLARKTKLKIDTQTFEITQGYECYACSLKEIKEVVQYSSARLPWGAIVKWKINVNGKEFIISSLTISRLNFERHFWNKIKDNFSYYPKC